MTSFYIGGAMALVSPFLYPAGESCCSVWRFESRSASTLAAENRFDADFGISSFDSITALRH